MLLNRKIARGKLSVKNCDGVHTPLPYGRNIGKESQNRLQSSFIQVQIHIGNFEPSEIHTHQSLVLRSLTRRGDLSMSQPLCNPQSRQYHHDNNDRAPTDLHRF